MLVFFLNEDLVASPAVVLAGPHDIDVAVLERDRPAMPAGSWYADADDRLVRVGPGEQVEVPVPRPGRVHLRVAGLVADYRVYDVAVAPSPAPGCAVWPPVGRAGPGGLELPAPRPDVTGWLASDEAAAHRGRWVLLDGDTRVVAVADSPADLPRSAVAAGLTVVFVPRDTGRPRIGGSSLRH